MEQKMLIGQMEQEKADRKRTNARGGVTEDYSEDTEACSESNPTHRKKKLKIVAMPNRPKKVAPEKSLISKEWKLDIKTLEKLDDVDKPPTDGELNFLKDQLTSNTFLKTYMRDWDQKISKILDKEPAIDKLKLRVPMMDKLIENSPTRRAK